MIQPKSFIYLLLPAFFISLVYTQIPHKKKIEDSAAKVKMIYDHFIYDEGIKSVSLYPTGYENHFPIISLAGDQVLQITFDDIPRDIRTLYYSIEQCNADWKPSRIPIMDYVDGFVEDRIHNAALSENTLIPFTHYHFALPNENTPLKLAGNYLLKVYEDGNQSNLLFTSRFYVVDHKTEIEAIIQPSAQSSRILHNQKINVSLHTSHDLINPLSTLQIHIFQNQRPYNFKIVKQPSNISSQKIDYNHPSTLDFEGNNEFRTVDLRNVRSASTNVSYLRRDTSSIHAYLVIDQNTSNNNYVWRADENGRFYSRNLDLDSDKVQSEYIYTHFSLQDSSNIDRDIYLVRGFNNYKKTPSNKLT